MEGLKDLFGESSLNYEQFEEKVNGANIKLFDLNSGDFVAKKKFADAEASADEYKTKYDELFAKVGDYDKIKADYEEMNTKYGELQAKQDLADKMSLIAKANVQPQFAKFVYSEVKDLTNDNKDFQTALSEYLKKNAQFINGGRGTYVDLQNGVGTQKSANAIFNEQLRKLKVNNRI